jgi:head-tail adaptor
MVAAGRLRERIVILRWSRSETAGSLGTPVDQWLPEETSIAAERRDVSDGEKAAAGALLSVRRTRFLVRRWARTDSVTAKDRLRHGATTFEIVGVKQVVPGSGAATLLEWTCEARVDA